MSELTDLESVLLAIPSDQIIEPDMPVHIAVSEALILQKQADKDRNQLISRKLDWSLVDSLGTRALALQEADTLYTLTSFGTNELKSNWDKYSTEALELRSELSHAMLYAFDGNEELLDTVRMIMQGSSYADLVQDQSHLEGLGIKHKDLLDAAGIDFSLVERAGQLKVILGDLLARTSVDKSERSIEKQMLNRAFTYMFQAVDKIRKCGKSVFWKDAAHSALYASAYQRKQRRKYEKNKSSATENKEAVTA